MRTFYLVLAIFLATSTAVAQPTVPSSSPPSGNCEAANFVESSDIQRVAEAYALDMVDFARENFSVALDWSDTSVSAIEGIMDIFYRERATANPTAEQVWSFSKMFGSYVGEVYRRNHGANWGTVTLNGESFPGMQAAQTCTLFWPWGRAQNRLTDGPENNMWHYYQSLLETPRQ